MGRKRETGKRTHFSPGFTAVGHARTFGLTGTWVRSVTVAAVPKWEAISS
jgi:hypothetical protein